MGMPRMGMTTKADQLAEKLKLTKEQKDQVGAILKAAAESAAPLGQQLDKGRQMMTQAMVKGTDSGDDYNKLLTAITDVQIKLDGIEAKAYADIYALLKPNQQKSGEQVFTEVMAGIFNSPVGGPGRGGRRGQ